MEKIQNILNENIVSRINAYIYLKELKNEKSFLDLKDINYLDFEKEGYKFFKGNNLTPTVFNRGKFFDYVKNISLEENKILVIDNLEIIQNILFAKEEFQEFFKEMELQKFKNKVIFVFSNIRIMKLKKELKSYYPEKNIIIGDQNED